MNTDHPVMPDTRPELEISSKLLLSGFVNENGDQVREQPIPTDQILEVSGKVKEVNVINRRITVLLKGEDEEPPFIICDLQPNQKEKAEDLSPDDSVKIKGVFKGFLKDAILLDCIITYSRSNE